MVRKHRLFYLKFCIYTKRHLHKSSSTKESKEKTQALDKSEENELYYEALTVNTSFIFHNSEFGNNPLEVDEYGSTVL